MHLRFILFVYYDVGGGHTVQTMQLVERLRATGHEVSLVSVLRDIAKAHPIPPGVPVTVVPRPGWRGALRVLRDGLRHRADVVVWSKGRSAEGHPLVYLLLRALHRKLVTIEHTTVSLPDVSLGERGGWLTKRLLRWYRLAKVRVPMAIRQRTPHHVLCVNEVTRERLSATFRLRPGRAHVFPNGVDAARFRFSADDRARARGMWGCGPETFVLGMVGRISEEKNHRNVILAVVEALRREPGRELRLLVLGEGPLRAELEAWSGSVAAGVVRFLGHTPEPERVYAGFDVYLQPSWLEGLPLGLLEAMASERCAIASPVGGVPEVLAGGTVGDLVDAGDVAGLAEAVLRLAALTPAERQALGRRARARVLERYEASHTCSSLARFLTEEDRKPFGIMSPTLPPNR